MESHSIIYYSFNVTGNQNSKKFVDFEKRFFYFLPVIWVNLCVTTPILSPKVPAEASFMMICI